LHNLFTKYYKKNIEKILEKYIFNLNVTVPYQDTFICCLDKKRRRVIRLSFFFI